ncbi:MAG: hypothetical protein ACFFF4_17560 [Candidatus Thorarchaeota archaeon]
MRLKLICEETSLKRYESMKILEILGISINARDFQVLGVLLNLQTMEQRGYTVDEIHTKVNARDKKQFSKAWIYKCLSNLEQEAFVVVNRINSPNTYSTNLDVLTHALETIIDRMIINLRKEEANLLKDISILENLESDGAAQFVLELVTGETRERPTGVIEGVQNIRSAIVRELCTDVGQEDTLRIYDKANLLNLYEISSGHVEHKIVEAAQQGANVHVILDQFPFADASEDTEIDYFFKGEGAILEEPLSSGNLQVRVKGEDEVGYRMLSLNREKMLLFLADAPKPDTVALITREANSVIIDSAVDSFDAAWQTATDITNKYLDRF